MAKLKSARRKCSKLQLNHARTIVFCMDRSCGKCASGEQMRASWKQLKRTLKRIGPQLDQPVVRLKAECVGVCKGGPLMAIFPDGVWYGGCSPEVVDTILESHLIDGEIVAEHVIAQPDEAALSLVPN